MKAAILRDVRVRGQSSEVPHHSKVWGRPGSNKEPSEISKEEPFENSRQVVVYLEDLNRRKKIREGDGAEHSEKGWKCPNRAVRKDTNLHTESVGSVMPPRRLAS